MKSEKELKKEIDWLQKQDFRDPVEALIKDAMLGCLLWVLYKDTISPQAALLLRAKKVARRRHVFGQSAGNLPHTNQATPPA